MHAQHESGRWRVGSRSVGNAEKAGGWVGCSQNKYKNNTQRARQQLWQLRQLMVFMTE